MRFHRLVLVGVALGTLLAATSRTRAQQPTPAATPVSPDMGRLALLRAAPDETFASSLQAALRSPDAGLRAVAARIVGVGRITALSGVLAAELAAESNDDVAVELLRALLLCDVPDAAPAISAYVAKSGTRGLRVYAEHLARMHPERLAAELPALSAHAKQAADADLAPAIALAVRQHPEIREALARAWMSDASADGWRALLDDMKAPTTRDSPAQQFIVAGLDAANVNVRQESVWRIVRWMADGADVWTSLLDHAETTTQPMAAGSWEAAGREILSRRHASHARVDLAALIEQQAARHPGDAVALANMPGLSKAEDDALRAALGGAGPRSAPIDAAAMAPMRLVVPPWPGFLTSLIDASGCNLSMESAFGLVQIAYRPDGRPASAGVGQTLRTPGCQAALRALPGVTIVDDDAAIQPEAVQWLVFPVLPDVVACVDAPSMPATAAGAATTVVPPAKTTDVPPRYPASATVAGTGGGVMLDATISARGCVSRLRIQKSLSQPLDLSALIAVSQWGYTPATANGTPVDASIAIEVPFKP
jgi:TonB family protein